MSFLPSLQAVQSAAARLKSADELSRKQGPMSSGKRITCEDDKRVRQSRLEREYHQNQPALLPAKPRRTETVDSHYHLPRDLLLQDRKAIRFDSQPAVHESPSNRNSPRYVPPHKRTNLSHQSRHSTPPQSSCHKRDNDGSVTNNKSHTFAATSQPKKKIEGHWLQDMMDELRPLPEIPQYREAPQKYQSAIGPFSYFGVNTRSSSEDN